MAHFGVLAYKGAGHLNPLLALAAELARRGHKITFFLPPELEFLIRLCGFGFVPITVKAHARSAASGKIDKPRGAIDWIKDTHRRLRRIDEEMGDYLRLYPDAIWARNIDALIMGEITLTGPTVAELLRIPYIVISTSIPHNFGWNAPARMRAAGAWQERLQQKLLQVSIFNIRGPLKRLLNRHRSRMGLGTSTWRARSFPELLHITQWPRCLDIARSKLPSRFHYAGPFAGGSIREHVPFPWHRLDARPLVYASLGTTKRAEVSLFQRIAEACATLGLQLVITLGGRSDAPVLDAMPGDPIVVARAPQLELLKRAGIVITHAGPNTVLETLLHGKPMLALPLALDQPTVAAHLERLGCAIVLGVSERSVQDIQNSLTRLGNDSRYRFAAEEIQVELNKLAGTSTAADLIETHLNQTSAAI